MDVKKARTEKSAFVNVNVVTMLNDAVVPNQTVIIADGKIETIANTGEITIPADTLIIDGKNKYLLPSLIDMHVHLGDNQDDLLLYLVNGVTTIRNMWGYENFNLRNWLFGTRVFNHLHLRDAINNGDVPGPTIVSAGSLIEGAEPFFPKFMVKSINSTKAAEEVVQKQVAQGYDLVKFYSTISAEVFNTLVRTAKSSNTAIAGHVPDQVGLLNVVKAKVTSVEHLFGFFNPYDPSRAVKESEIPTIAQLSAENDVYHCPTLIASERICNWGSREQYKSEPGLSIYPEGLRMVWTCF